MIHVPASSARERAMWTTLLELAAQQSHWTLVGARMVELHAREHGRTMARATVDADALGDARIRPNPVRRLAEILVASGFTLTEPNAFGEAHTFHRNDVEIDVLAPDSARAIRAQRRQSRRRTRCRSLVVDRRWRGQSW